MGTKVTMEEFRILEASFIEDKENGTEIAKCPRCGNIVVRKQMGNSSITACKTEDCISYGMRGI